MITSRCRSTRPQVPESQSRAVLVAAVAGLVLASPPVLGQTSPAAPGGAMPPPREGNIYGGKDHQPTEAEVGGAEGPAGIDSSSPANKAKVEQGVERLLEQTDMEDKAAKQRMEGAPSDSSPPDQNNGR